MLICMWKYMLNCGVQNGRAFQVQCQKKECELQQKYSKWHLVMVTFLR